LGIAAGGLSERIAGVLSSLGLPDCIPEDLGREDILRLMRVDKKKRDGLVRFALPVEIGKVQTGVEVKDLELVFRED
jgi:3-dehydroquinate synthetase